MEGGHDSSRSDEAVKGFASLPRTLGDQLDPHGLDVIPDFVRNSHQPRVARAHDEHLRSFSKNLLQVFHVKSVSLPPPPTTHNPVWENDDIGGVPPPIDDDSTKLVGVDRFKASV